MSENWYCTGCGSTSYPWHHLGCTGPRPVVAVAPSGEPSDGYSLADAVRNLPVPLMADPLLCEVYDQALAAAADFVRSRAASVLASPAGDDQ